MELFQMCGWWKLVCGVDAVALSLIRQQLAYTEDVNGALVEVEAAATKHELLFSAACRQMQTASAVVWQNALPAGCRRLGWMVFGGSDGCVGSGELVLLMDSYNHLLRWLLRR